MTDQRQFSSGAVRDAAEGKGRCDLLPFGTLAKIFPEENEFYRALDMYQATGDAQYLVTIINHLLDLSVCKHETLLALAKHFEKGSAHYGDRNWEKGIPTACYVDSGVRHYLKDMAGYEGEDENHYIAALWNFLCCLWTHYNRPECESYPLKHHE